ncbi:MAG: cyclopropane-fatty-acyl-phospholipid synthase family protein, partial [Burkholderiales bacterium]
HFDPSLFMNAKSLSLDSAAGNVPRGTALPWRARLVFRLLERMEVGALHLELPDGRAYRFGAGEPTAAIAIHDWAVFTEVTARGDVAFAEAFMRGAWTSPDPAALFDVLARNRAALERAVYGNVFGRWFDRLRHLLRSNTRAGSRKNIAAHYDLGNAFYALWLDRSMTYSSALFDGDATRSLASAQTAKYARVLERLSVQPGQHILEIGCGWGGFAEYAVRTADVRVTGISLSREQLRFAEARAIEGGFADRAQFEYRDYRDSSGRYDHVVSIEMYEAVGERYWPDYFAAIKRLLTPRGKAVIQAITIDELLFERYRAGSDFIQQYVFPGGMLASPARFEAEARSQGLEVRDAFRFGADYARTLRHWRDAFVNRLQEVRAQGFDERFVRMWALYLAYCEAGFTSGSTDVYHYELSA